MVSDGTVSALSQKEEEELPWWSSDWDFAFHCGEFKFNQLPSQGAGITGTLWPKSQDVEQKQHCNEFNEDFKGGPH